MCRKVKLQRAWKGKTPQRAFLPADLEQNPETPVGEFLNDGAAAFDILNFCSFLLFFKSADIWNILDHIQDEQQPLHDAEVVYPAEQQSTFCHYILVYSCGLMSINALQNIFKTVDSLDVLIIMNTCNLGCANSSRLELWTSAHP